MTVTPDLAGFADAQERMRELMGQSIVFRIPVAATWPSGTAVDPETNQPYDPTVVPSTGGSFNTTTKTVNVIARPLRPGRHGPTSSEAAGMMLTEQVCLVLATADYSAVQNATEFIWNSRTYSITDMLLDGLPPATRYLVFGEPQ